jgi:hypothetical protein
MNIVETRSQVAKHFGVHLRTFATWLGAGCPGQPGAYDLDQIAAWRNQPRQAPLREQSGSAAASASAMLALAAAVNRLAAAIERQEASENPRQARDSARAQRNRLRPKKRAPDVARGELSPVDATSEPSRRRNATAAVLGDSGRSPPERG